MKKFNIEIQDEEPVHYGDHCAHVASYDIEKSRVVNKDQIVTRRHNITILFDYPLGEPTTLSFKKKGGFKVRDIHRAICKGYQRIYKKEDGFIASHPDEDSPYLIWGHDIGDLVIEAVIQKKPGYFELHIGS